MEIAIVVVFVAGYFLIAIEHPIGVDKAATALLTGVVCWTLHVLGGSSAEQAADGLAHHLFDIAGILFFLLGAMTLVGLIDAHDGFSVITQLIRTNRTRTLLVITGLLGFFLSAVLDNLTTTIVMISLIRKIVDDQELRLVFAGLIVIAANAGGAWSPIGDITTVMLWSGHQLPDIGAMMRDLIVPSLVCLAVPLVWFCGRVPATFARRDAADDSLQASKSVVTQVERDLVLVTGVACLLLVPVFKTVTHLPPFMGMMGAVGLMWVLTEWIHRRKPEDVAHRHRVEHILTQVDTPSILFFLGILLAVAALQEAGLLGQAAGALGRALQGQVVALNLLIGVMSAIVDNVPLVAAVQGMYPLASTGVMAPNGEFWTLLAFCAGTGGSILIIGSAAGVAAMGLESISFGWYLKRVAPLALAGYLAGVGVFVMLHG